MEIPEVSGGGGCRLLGVQPLIDPLVYSQAVTAGGAGHELPEPFGAGTRHGQRIVTAFDHGDERQVLREPLVTKHVANHAEIATRAVQPQLDDLAPAPREALDERLDLTVDDEGIGRCDDRRAKPARLRERLGPGVRGVLDRHSLREGCPGTTFFRQSFHPQEFEATGIVTRRWKGLVLQGCGRSGKRIGSGGREGARRQKSEETTCDESETGLDRHECKKSLQRCSTGAADGSMTLTLTTRSNKVSSKD